MYYANPLSMMQQALVATPGGRPAPAAPQYFGPVHQALANSFTNNLNNQRVFSLPNFIQGQIRYPNLYREDNGFNFNSYSRPANNDWRIDWFPERKAQAADPLAAVQPNTTPTVTADTLAGLLANSGVRAGQNDVGGA